MLYLIGLGLHDEKDITHKGMDAIKKCDSVYIELFTNNWQGDIKNLEKLSGKTITELKRKEVESDLLIKYAKRKSVALLIPGDPLTATTHIHLVMEAAKSNVPVRIIHSSSVFTAAAETGLQLYKFGRTTTLPKQGKNYPASVFDPIKENRKQGLHTLVLLDIGMTAAKGLKILSGVVKEDVVACCRLGSKNQTICYGKIAELEKRKGLDRSPAIIIVPGRLHFMEEEMLNLWKTQQKG